MFNDIEKKFESTWLSKYKVHTYSFMFTDFGVSIATKKKARPTSFVVCTVHYFCSILFLFFPTKSVPMR